MSPEARRRAERVLAKLTDAQMAVRSALDEAQHLGGYQRPRLYAACNLVDEQHTVISRALSSDTAHIYIVCGKEREAGGTCTREQGHYGECARDYSPEYQGLHA